MILCFILFGVLFLGKKRIPDKKIWLVLFCCNSIALLLFIGAWKREQVVQEIERNSYGEGERTETYYVSVDGELDKEELILEIGERRYTQEEAKELFQKVMKELDELILGKMKAETMWNIQ